MKLTTEDAEVTEKVKLLVQLVSGLLASGVYTTNRDDDDEKSFIKSYEVDWEDWKEAGFPRKHPFHVIDDAEVLLRDIEFIVKQEGGK